MQPFLFRALVAWMLCDAAWSHPSRFSRAEKATIKLTPFSSDAKPFVRPESRRARFTRTYRARQALSKRAVAFARAKRSSKPSPLPSSTPGYVAAATRLDSSDVKSVSGLVFTASTAADSVNFTLGTSSRHATMVNMVPFSEHDESLGALANVVQLRISILDSQKLEAYDYCATFGSKPPTPLTLEVCGNVQGWSQNFLWNSTTGELLPVALEATLLATNETASPADDTPQQAGTSLYFIPASQFQPARKETKAANSKGKSRTARVVGDSVDTSVLDELSQPDPSAPAYNAVQSGVVASAPPASLPSASLEAPVTPLQALEASPSAAPSASVSMPQAPMVNIISNSSEPNASTVECAMQHTQVP